MNAQMVNGNDVEELKAYIEKCRADPTLSQRRPVMTGVWLGADRSRVTIGENTLEVNAPGTLGPMQLALAALVSCEIDVIATHCTLMGVEIDELTVEARGAFDVRSYLGVAPEPGSGYERIEYVVKLRAPSLTREQLARVRDAVRRASPVGDTLTRRVRVDAVVDATV